MQIAFQLTHQQVKKRNRKGKKKKNHKKNERKKEKGGLCNCLSNKSGFTLCSQISLKTRGHFTNIKPSEGEPKNKTKAMLMVGHHLTIDERGQISRKGGHILPKWASFSPNPSSPCWDVRWTTGTGVSVSYCFLGFFYFFKTKITRSCQVGLF